MVNASIHHNDSFCFCNNPPKTVQTRKNNPKIEKIGSVAGLLYEFEKRF